MVGFELLLILFYVLQNIVEDIIVWQVKCTEAANNTQPREKLIGQSKEVKLNLTGPRNFDIRSCVIISYYDQILNSERETER